MKNIAVTIAQSAEPQSDAPRPQPDCNQCNTGTRWPLTGECWVMMISSDFSSCV